jgi:hypothetical protein
MRSKSPRRRAVGFAIGTAVVFALVALWLWLRKHHPIAAISIGSSGALLLLIAPLWPPGVLAIRWLWMTVAGAIGWVNSRILLGVLFFVVLTPIALLRRALGRPPLDTQWRPGTTPSYFRTRDSEYDAKHYEHLF